jgi:TetR/AcrR family fatty acid metabolism transcriptional regulator
MSKRQSIIDVARKRFRYYGVAKTTMQEIAADAGVAVGTLYLYFRNKDDLMVACTEEFVEHHRRVIEKTLAEDLPADEKLRRYIVNRFRQSEETRTSSRHAAEITRAVLRLKPDRIEEEGRMMQATVEQIFAQGIRDRLFRIADPPGDARVFLFAIAVFFPNALSAPSFEPREEDLVAIIGWFTQVWKQAAKGRKAARQAR